MKIMFHFITTDDPTMNCKRMTFRVLWVVLFALLAVPVQAQTWDKTSDGYEATVTRTFSVEAGGSFVIERVVGGITVEAWDQNRVEIKEILRFDEYSRSEAEAYLQAHGSTFEKRGNAVTVRGPDRENRRNRVQRDYEARVPARFNTDVETAGGSINVSGLTGTVQVRTAGGGLNLSDITGDLTARTAGGGVNLSNIDGQVEARTAGGGINVEEVTGRLNVATSGGGINIVGVESDVTAQTSGGGVHIERVSGRVSARTAGGDMTVREATREVDVQTSGGDIELRSIGGRVSARTAGGDIEGRDLGGQVSAETSAGDIELDEVRGGVQARTSVGDIDVAVTLQDFSQDYPMSLETTHGDITLMLPPTLPASIDARVRSLGGGWDRDDIYSDFALAREGPRARGSGDLRSYGDINGGGPPIRLRTSGGSIRIEKGQ